MNFASLRRGFLRQARRHDAHSLYLVFASMLLGTMLIFDLIMNLSAAPQWLTVVLVTLCLSSAALAFGLGSRISRVVGIAAVLLFTAAQAYFLSQPNDPDNVLAAVQQLPIVAFYLGWFVLPKLALTIIIVCSLVFSVAMATNPLLSSGGLIGMPVAVHGILVLLFCFFIGSYLRRRNMRRATTDPLTSARNREWLMERLQQAVDSRRNTPHTLVAIDFDDFKQLNDTHGHAAGDRALADSVRVWQEHTRARDVVARIGGDEFAILLHSATHADAENIMRRLQASAEHAWSWGAAQLQPSDTADSVMRRADLALYAQKQLKSAGGHSG